MDPASRLLCLLGGLRSREPARRAPPPKLWLAGRNLARDPCSPPADPDAAAFAASFFASPCCPSPAGLNPCAAALAARAAGGAPGSAQALRAFSARLLELGAKLDPAVLRAALQAAGHPDPLQPLLLCCSLEPAFRQLLSPEPKIYRTDKQKPIRL